MNHDLSRAVWRKSIKSANNGGCVEVADLDAVVAVRDSKHIDGQALLFAGAEWDTFIAAIADGEFHQH